MGLVLVGAVKPLRAMFIVPTQIVAAIAAAAVVDGLLPLPLNATNTLKNGTTPVQGLFLEMFLTAQLVLAVYFLAVEKHPATFLAPIGIGISVFIAHIAGTNYTGTGINPARSFGPAVISGFVHYHWIYWLGPCMGALLAFGLYSILKWLEYGTANPGQDAEDVETANAEVMAAGADGAAMPHEEDEDDQSGSQTRRSYRSPDKRSRGRDSGRHIAMGPVSPVSQRTYVEQSSSRE